VKKVMSLSKQDQLSLWTALQSNNPTLFWSINGPQLLSLPPSGNSSPSKSDHHDSSPISAQSPPDENTSVPRFVPLRVYYGWDKDRPFIQEVTIGKDPTTGLF
jgi:hypothetical protein